MRLRARIDANQPEIVAVLKAHGFSVFHAHQLGKGFPDLVTGRHKKTWLVEVKTEKGALTDDQKKFQELWRGAPIVYLSSVAETLEFIQNS